MKPALCTAAALVLLQCATCRAQDADEAGLRLADETPQASAGASAPQLSVEPALVWTRSRPDGTTHPGQRVGVDWTWRRESGGWQLQFADRLDLRGPARLDGEKAATNTLKELFASVRIGNETLVDAGRVNTRFGVATGFNPTDYFRDRAVRSATSVDPASLRENRLGTVMLRTQRLWNGGSATAIVAPRLADAPDPAGMAIDLGATNSRTRWLLGFSHTFAPDLAPQWLLHGTGRPGDSPQLGLNLTRLLNKACVAQLEWTGGRGTTLLGRALGRPLDDRHFRAQWAGGATCTTSNNVSLTLEWQHNGEALDADGWRSLRDGPLPVYLAYRGEAQRGQDPATRDNLFLFARWQNAFVARLDLGAFTRINAADHSRLAWAEARYRWPSTDLAVQLQDHSGSGLSEFGALAQQRVLQVLLKHFF